MAEMRLQETLSAEEVRQLCGFANVRTVYAKAKTGAIPGYRAPGTKMWLFRKSEVYKAIGMEYVEPEDAAGIDAQQAARNAVRDITRHQMIKRVYTDILADLAICEIEGWDKEEYIGRVREALDAISGNIAV